MKTVERKYRYDTIKKGLFLSLFFLFSMNLSARKGFAIVIDPVSHRKALPELNGYIKALEEIQHFKVYTVIDRWGVPDSIRQELMRLHSLEKEAIVGAVFIGDIPIPMIRDAQFLTSAFKMNQNMPWHESSVPSDRFYDDFGLQFRFLKKDSIAPLFYYSLTHEGSQKLHPSLFSGRIRPTDASGTSRYEKLRQYLRKATEAKRHPEPVQAVFVYTGSGSLNESRVAHIDEQQALREHFPKLTLRPNAFSYMDYGDERFIKRKLMNEMMRPDLSIGLMHHHGTFDTQYLTHYPKPSGTEQALEYLLYSYRYRLQRAQRYHEDLDSIRQMLTKRDQLPETWLKNEPTPENLHRDSLMEDSLNLTLKDFPNYGYHPNCRVVFYDACYNAAFQNEDCIANEYIFQPGKTIAGVGATVNVLQDKWPDRYIGMLAHGMSIGELNQITPELEMHVVGDPTFTFLTENDNRQSADKQCVEMFRKGLSISDEQLMQILRISPYGIVRLQAFMLLQERNSSRLAEAIETASHDNYELLQRFSVNAMQKCGHPRLAKALARLVASNNTSARVAFDAMEAVQFFPEKAITEAMNEALDSIAPYVTWPEEYKKIRMNNVAKYAGRWAKEISEMCNGKSTEKQALRYADMMKIYLPPWLTEDVARYTVSIQEPDLQVKLLDALGWHRLGYKNEAVKTAIRPMITNPSFPEKVRNEAIKTLKRLE